MTIRSLLLLPVIAILLCPALAMADDQYVDMLEDVLIDKIQGGLLAEIIANLNGLPHELKYNDAPGDVKEYTPGLPEGGRTDDDTDIEWIYICEMERSGELLVPPKRIVELWKAHVNKYVWCANLYSRRLMDIGFTPPMTGQIAFNPWSEFNISGQFVCEAFGLVAPGMPQAASKIGLHYTHVTIDGEPAQTTQLFDTMIATAFVETDIEKIVAAGLAAVDKKSVIHEVVTDVVKLWKQYPNDWRKNWHAIHDKYAKHGGMRDFNGHELNTASIIGAMLYAKGDFVETIRMGFNFGYDADCNAATAATIIGVIKGRGWIDSQGWTFKDVYKNITRPGMPEDETITRYGDRIVAVAKNVIETNGGETFEVHGKKMVRIKLQQPKNVEPLADPIDRMDTLRGPMQYMIQHFLDGTELQQAKLAYVALCIGESENLAKSRPEDWKRAIEALKKHPKMVKMLFQAPPTPTAKQLQARAEAAGLERPKK